MPAQRPRASFEPIAPNFDLDRLVENTPNFAYVDRINCDMIDQQGIAAFEKLVTLHVIVGGKPLVVDGFERRLDPWTFTPKWLRDNCGEKVEHARNLMAKENLPLTMKHYLNNMGLLTNQFFDKPDAYKDKKRQRMYLKDIDCPAVWWDKVQEHIPAFLAYLNESTGDFGGPGAVPDLTSTVPGRRLGRGIARAGDLMSSLPADMRAENLMCYIGHEGTFTPAHREMCASLGHNIMVEASSTVNEEGQVEKPGSSIWFMTESKDRTLVSEYWLSVLGHDIEVENHFAQVVAWKKAPFSVYIVDQRPGDLILIPPLAPHQVWNRGTRTMKVAWNRTTVETLEMALNEAIPRSRIVCRDEQYKNKAIIYYTLQKYASLLTLAQQQASRMPPEAGHNFLYTGKLRQLQKDFKRLFNLFKQIMLSEMFNPSDRDSNSAEYLPFDSNVTCAYCRGNIFNRFLTCPSCKDLLGHHAEDGEGDPYDVCMECYAMGRSCACISNLKWVEQFRWKELTAKYDLWRKLIIAFDGGQITAKTPLSLLEERKKLGKKSLAEICKEQLKRRPFNDVKKASQPKDDDEEEDEEIVVGDDGRVKKIKRKRSKAWEKQNQPCHVCCSRQPIWKMANCTTCEKWFCYGTLFRGWDKMPQEIMEDPDWSCPHCLGICFAGGCKKDPRMTPYEPKGTLLGHDTKRVADVRSVEALVDFSVSNLNWIKGDNPEVQTESGRFKRAEAEAQRSKEIDHTLDDDDEVDQSQLRMEGDESPAADAIDPALGGRGGGRESVNGMHNGDLNDAMLAHRLQLANSSLPSQDAYNAPDGYRQIAEGGGYSVPEAPMYPLPTDTNGYAYSAAQHEHDGFVPMEAGDARPAKKSKKRRQPADDDEGEDIAMTKAPKAKKSRLAAAGFRSYDLAEAVPSPSSGKAKSEAQRQFEREKERKALDKAKAEGRFIMFSAALRGKKRIVKLPIPSFRLAQIETEQLARAALANSEDVDAEHDLTEISHAPDDTAEDNVLLRSDIPVKNPKPSKRTLYEEAVRSGRIITSNTKKARVPVEKDDTYGYRERVRMPNKKQITVTSTASAAAVAAQRGRRNGAREYEEVDIGSSDDDAGEPEDDAVPTQPQRPSDRPVIDSSATAEQGTQKKDRRSLPGYLQTRHEGDEDLPDELPDDFRFRKEPSKAFAKRTDIRRGPNGAFVSSTAGKRPSMRPAHVTAGEDDEADAAGDDDEDDINSFINQAANGQLLAEANAHPTFTSINGGAVNPPKATARPKGKPSRKLGPKTAVPVQPPQMISSDEESDDAEYESGLENHPGEMSVEEQNRLAKLQAMGMVS